MDLIRPFLPFVAVALVGILAVDVFFLMGLGFGRIETLVALAFPALFGWVLGGFVPERYWGPYFTLSWLMVLAAPFALRVGKGSMTDQPLIAFVILFATGCMFAAQSLRMLSRFDRDAIAKQDEDRV
jgi:hypothetical protein